MRSIVFAAGALLFSGTIVAAASLPGPVVDAEWLAANVGNVQVVAVQSDPSAFIAQPVWQNNPKTGAKTLVEANGHLPGSKLVNTKNIRVERKIGELSVKYMVPGRADFERIMQAAGLAADRPIVLVALGQDGAELDDAARLYWQLKYFGEDRVAILDGGLAGWLVDGRAVSTDAPDATPGDWKAGPERTALIADSAEVAQSKAQLIDARALPQYHGLAKRDYVYAYGHIPGAHALPPEVRASSDGGVARFLSADDYRTILEQSGIKADAPAITYCNSGHLAAGAWFVMSEVVGNKQVRLYDGSLHEWTLEKRPMEGIARR
ncbi:MAG: sulfurtransferase [Zoogloeaceae bacterium]|nr:sulfurtransferase [Zoogloeaceae bacterium]MCP5239566.1 sulfurtransferase [Zoogloeaceae bacterium]MCP5255904.1 sulfurtransferase [Zoogloeaceae bacterium]MCW5615074.1 sulfurtransferase [Rhodocyclaceae bacterium]